MFVGNLSEERAASQSQRDARVGDAAGVDQQQVARLEHHQRQGIRLHPIPGSRPSAGAGEPPQAPLSGGGRGGGDQLVTPALQGLERSRRAADAEGMPGGGEGQQRRSPRKGG